jgi:hypothetical protein
MCASLRNESEKGTSTTFKFEEEPLEFVGIIPLDRRFKQYGIPKMIITRNQIP